MAVSLHLVFCVGTVALLMSGWIGVKSITDSGGPDAAVGPDGNVDSGSGCDGGAGDC
jgi:hypothetical protein